MGIKKTLRSLKNGQVAAEKFTGRSGEIIAADSKVVYMNIENVTTTIERKIFEELWELKEG